MAKDDRQQELELERSRLESRLVDLGAKPLSANGRIAALEDAVLFLCEEAYRYVPPSKRAFLMALAAMVHGTSLDEGEWSISATRKVMSTDWKDDDGS